jgi:hypothetical protein
MAYAALKRRSSTVFQSSVVLLLILWAFSARLEVVPFPVSPRAGLGMTVARPAGIKIP